MDVGISVDYSCLLVAIPLFVWNATNAILSSTDGDFGEIVTDPSEPGYLTYVTGDTFPPSS